jgi:ABC-type transport system involved in multi-copper enzyme maturation permease subunit
MKDTADERELSEKERRIMSFLGKQAKSRRSILLGAFFGMLTGLVLIISGLLYLGSTCILGGLYFFTIGIYVLVVNSRYVRIYGLMKKLM